MHDIFGDFIEIMAENINNYCQEKNITGVDLEFAKKLAWGTLYNYDIFETYADNDEAELLIAYEHENHTNAKGPKNCN